MFKNVYFRKISNVTQKMWSELEYEWNCMYNRIVKNGEAFYNDVQTIYKKKNNQARVTWYIKINWKYSVIFSFQVFKSLLCHVPLYIEFYKDEEKYPIPSCTCIIELITEERSHNFFNIPNVIFRYLYFVKFFKKVINISLS